MRRHQSNTRPGGWLSRGALCAALAILLAGCSSLLPSSKEETVSEWHAFEQVKASYDKIAVGQSAAELQGLGFDLVNSPNLQILSYLDVAAMLQAIPASELDPGLRQCLQSRDECRAYVFELKRIKSKRVGNFWADFFNFRRKTESSGWRFKALLVMINDRVAYKLWSGSPSAETYREDRNPLGPLQGSGDKVLNLF
jgi:hypothetical protein